MNRLRQVTLKFAACLAFGFAGTASADPDEAWLVRAPLHANTRPLLVIVLDTSGAMSQRIMAAEPFDPLIDYAGAVSGPGQCDAKRVYWRRGPGPVPDCALMAGIPLTTSTALAGMQCDSALGALAQHGYFVTARAAQWNPADRRWDALRADRSDAVECRSDRGRHGRVSGSWFATDGASGPWSDAAAAEIDWNAPPHGSSYVFYSGNFLNYLAAVGPTT